MILNKFIYDVELLKFVPLLSRRLAPISVNYTDEEWEIYKNCIAKLQEEIDEVENDN